MDIENETLNIIKKYDIRANKKLGQNFLIDDNIISGIIDAADIDATDIIIEIGPGLGTITSKLLEKAYKVVAIELDSKMVDVINDRFKLYDNLIVINDDVLKLDLKSIINKEKSTGKVKVVANLPYYISTPIIIELLEKNLNIDEIIVMVQKEVADRITAMPGTKLAGSITYMVDYYAEAKKILDVSKRCFIPSPKVESEVIELKIRNKPKIMASNEKLLFDLIKKSFTQRRKMLINTLVNFNLVDCKEKAIEVLKKSDLDPNTRGETLTLEQFENIAKNL